MMALLTVLLLPMAILLLMTALLRLIHPPMALLLMVLQMVLRQMVQPRKDLGLTAAPRMHPRPQMGQMAARAVQSKSLILILAHPLLGL
jgi:hypothetical protein